MIGKDDTHTADLFAQYVAPTYGRFPIQPARGQGTQLWDEGGRRFLDFAAGVAVSSLGHAHPALLEVFRRQPADLIHCSNLYQPRGQGLLAKALVEDVVGVAGKCFFANSGTEANEGLIKLARRFGQVSPAADGTPRREIITFTGSFHGRSTGAMAATGQDKVRLGFGPLMSGFTYLPFNDVDALRAAVSDDTVAILLEPVQGEGGIRIATGDFLSAAAELCRERDILLMFDEVQCGIARCGSLCGWHAIGDTEGIVPDAISWAKGLGGGFPLGAIWFKDRPLGEARLPDLLGPGTHGCTYGGSPLASAIGLAVLGAIRDEGLCENATRLGAEILETARGWQHPLIAEVRGLGLMIGFEIDAAALAAAEGFAASERPPSLFVIDALTAAGLLTVPAGENVVRWLPPLTVTGDEVAEALRIFRETLDTLLV